MSNYVARLRSNIAAEMARKDLTQKETAEALGMPQTGFSSRLNGRTDFRLGELITLSNLLHLHLEQLVEGVHLPAPETNGVERAG